MPATFTISRKRLLEGVKAAAQIVPRRGGRPILETVCLSVGERVELSACNLEQSLLSPLDAVVEGSASVLVRAVPLQKALTTIKAAEVTVHIDQDRLLTIVADGTERTIPGEFLVAEYPRLAEETAEAEIVLAGADLAHALRQTVCYCDVESTRYALAGVQFEVAPGKLTLCATDTRRLATIEIPAAGCALEHWEGVVPLVACKALLRQIAEGSVVQWTVTPSSVTFRVSESVVSTRLIEGRFPRWRDVIPTQGQHTLELRRAEFRAALIAILPGRNDEFRGCEWTIGERELSLRCGDTATGSAVSRCPILNQRFVDQRVPAIDFDPLYLLDYLDAVPALMESVQVSLIDGNSAALFTAEGAARYVLMPLGREDRPAVVFSPVRIVAAVKQASAYVASLTGVSDRGQIARKLRTMRGNPLGRGVLELQIRRALDA